MFSYITIQSIRDVTSVWDVLQLLFFLQSIPPSPDTLLFSRQGCVHFLQMLCMFLCELQAHDDEQGLGGATWNTSQSMDGHGSVLHQIREAQFESEGTCEFVGKATEIMTSTSEL